MYTKKYWIAASCIVCLAILFLTSGCSSCTVSPDEQTLQVLEEAIDELGRQPGRWQDTMLNTILQLEKSGGQLAKTVLAEVRSTYNGIAGQTMGEYSCRVDFTAKRLQQRLQAIGHGIAPDRFPEPEIVPVICSTNPGDQVQLDTNLLVFYGYDLLEFSETQEFHAELRYADAMEVVREQAGYVSRTHNYQLEVDLQGPALKEVMRAMDRNRGPQIVLRWGAADVEDQDGMEWSLPIILPEPEGPPEQPELPCTWTGSVSEETGPAYCPNGYALRGLRCKGDFCDNMELYCCPYMPSADPNAQYSWSGWISEEDPNNSYETSSGFLVGLACSHDYCDNVRMKVLTTPNLRNLDQCGTKPEISEEGVTNEMDCGDGYFVAGMECRGRFCDNISLICCRSE